MLGDVETLESFGSNPSDCVALLAGIFTPPLLNNEFVRIKF
jgi:hypothetical protein